MRSKLIVEVTSGVSHSTIALAAAAQQTGGRLVCILPEPELAESKKAIKDLGLKDLVEFRTGDPSKLLLNYKKIDFSLVDCKNDDYTKLLKLLDVNPRRSVVVANNLVAKDKGLEGHLTGMDENVEVRSLKHPIGKGMEVTMISRKEEIDPSSRDAGGRSAAGIRSGSMKGNGKSKWVVKVDEDSGEEHIFRVPKSV